MSCLPVLCVFWWEILCLLTNFSLRVFSDLIMMCLRVDRFFFSFFCFFLLKFHFCEHVSVYLSKLETIAMFILSNTLLKLMSQPFFVLLRLQDMDASSFSIFICYWDMYFYLFIFFSLSVLYFASWVISVS